MSGYRSRRGRRAELSQHFLRSPALAASLVRQASLHREDVVVEIGPGRGLLTAELARRVGHVLAVEVDRELCGELRTQFSRNSRVSVIHRDFLEYELPTNQPFKVLGNIPFNRTAEIVRRVTEGRVLPTDAHLIVQWEAAQRFAGTPVGPETLASLLLKPDWHIEVVTELRSSDFEPPPRVSAAMIWFARRARGLVAAKDRPRYRSFVEDCFGRRGRTVSQCVRPYLTRNQLRRLSKLLRFDPVAPPSALTFDQWLRLFRFHAWHGRKR